MERADQAPAFSHFFKEFSNQAQIAKGSLEAMRPVPTGEKKPSLIWRTIRTGILLYLLFEIWEATRPGGDVEEATSEDEGLTS
jgi:hypothetical protein